MKKIFALLMIFGFVFLMVGCSSPQTRPDDPEPEKITPPKPGPTPTPQSLKIELKEVPSAWAGKSVESGFGDRYAILVGADEYTNRNNWNLSFVKKDIAKFREVLIKNLQFSPENIAVITGDRVIKKVILETVKGKFRSKIRGKDNLLLFYYGGHGFTSSGRRQHFLTYYSNIEGVHYTDTLDQFDLEGAFTKLRQGLNKEATLKIACIFDACQTEVKAPTAFVPRELKGSNATLTSCAPGQYSELNVKKGMSLFTQHLCEVLEKESRDETNKRLEIDGLFKKVQKAMENFGQKPALKKRAEEEIVLLSRTSIPVRFEVYDALKTDRSLEADLSLNGEKYKCPASVGNLQPGEYFLQVSFPGYFPKLEKILLKENHRGRSFHIYLTPEVVVIRGRVVEENQGAGTAGLEVSLLGSSVGAVTGYHKMRETLFESGRFRLLCPLFEDARTLLITQGSKILLRSPLKNYSLLDHRGNRVRIYNLADLSIRTTLPTLESLLSVGKATSTATPSSRIFILRDDLLKEDKSLVFGSPKTAQVYKIALRQIGRENLDFAALYIEKGLRDASGAVKEVFRSLEIECLLRQARKVYKKGNFKGSLQKLQEALKKGREGDRVRKSLLGLHQKEAGSAFAGHRFLEGVGHLLKAREYAGEKGKEEIKGEIYSRYLKEIQRKHKEQNYSAALSLVDEAKNYGPKAPTASLEYRLCEAYLTHCISEGVAKGDFSKAGRAESEARNRFSSHPKIAELLLELKRERIPLSSRVAYMAAGKALREADLEEGEKQYLKALQGANKYYQKKIGPVLKFIQEKLYLKYEAMGVIAFEGKRYEKAGRCYLKCFSYTPDDEVLSKILGDQILPRLDGEALLRVMEGIKGEILEKLQNSSTVKKVSVYLEAKGKDQNLSTFDDWLKKKLDPIFSAGFTYLRTQTYSCGGQTHTVKEYRHDRTGLEFVLVSGGTFQMGSTEWSNSQPVHSVTLKPFLMSKTEVTQRVWKKIMGTNPSYWKGDDLPVERVSWDNAKNFCQKVGATGRSPLQLPTEAQWEYACRAGTTSKYYWGGSMDGDYAWWSSNSGSKTHDVAQKKPNAFGLYDMAGNVWEWCEDGWNSNYNSAPNDGTAYLNTSSGGRVLRGGSWDLNVGGDYASAFRYNYASGYRAYYFGFRVVVRLRDH